MSDWFEWHVRYLRDTDRHDPCGLAVDEHEAIRRVHDLLVTAPSGSGAVGRICRVHVSAAGYTHHGLIAYATRHEPTGLVVWTPTRPAAAQGACHRPRRDSP